MVGELNVLDEATFDRSACRPLENGCKRLQPAVLRQGEKWSIFVEDHSVNDFVITFTAVMYADRDADVNPSF